MCVKNTYKLFWGLGSIAINIRQYQRHLNGSQVAKMKK